MGFREREKIDVRGRGHVWVFLGYKQQTQIPSIGLDGLKQKQCIYVVFMARIHKFYDYLDCIDVECSQLALLGCFSQNYEPRRRMHICGCIKLVLEHLL